MARRSLMLGLARSRRRERLTVDAMAVRPPKNFRRERCATKVDAGGSHACEGY
jgi:hypothetical protein